MLRKIISGGQTGADRAGLDFAIETGLEHGRYVPRGRKAEDGSIDERYNLVELSTSSYPARTRRNIEESNGTVIFSLQRLLSGGTKLTWEHAKSNALRTARFVHPGSFRPTAPKISSRYRDLLFRHQEDSQARRSYRRSLRSG